jgi:hypothetical protein
VADGMYLIEEGTVSIKMLQDGGEKEISKLEKGQYFGELALVTHKPRAASVYAQNGNVKVACKSIRFLKITRHEQKSWRVYIKIFSQSSLSSSLIYLIIIDSKTINFY